MKQEKYSSDAITIEHFVLGDKFGGK